MAKVTSILNPVHALLGQDPISNLTNYVTDDEISAFAQMAMRLLCSYADAYPLVGKLSLATGVPTYTLASMTSVSADDLSTQAYAHKIGKVQDVSYITSAITTYKEVGTSLRLIDQDVKGQVFYTSDPTPIFYSLHSNKVITLHPTPVFSSGSRSLLIQYTGIVTATVDLTNTAKWYLSPDWDDLVILYCAAKGKEKYQQYEHAAQLLAQFLASAGITPAQTIKEG